jgi:hypothetical protein
MRAGAAQMRGEAEAARKRDIPPPLRSYERLHEGLGAGFM